MKENKKYIIFFLCMLAVAAVLYASLFPKPKYGHKNISVTVVFSEDNTKDYKISTDAEYLRQALEEIELIKGDESSYGLFVTAVGGVAADASKEEWWSFTKDGETLNTGVDTTVIEDGDKFEITLVKGYSGF